MPVTLHSCWGIHSNCGFLSSSAASSIPLRSTPPILMTVLQIKSNFFSINLGKEVGDTRMSHSVPGTRKSLIWTMNLPAHTHKLEEPSGHTLQLPTLCQRGRVLSEPHKLTLLCRILCLESKAPLTNNAMNARRLSQGFTIGGFSQQCHVSGLEQLPPQVKFSQARFNMPL